MAADEMNDLSKAALRFLVAITEKAGAPIGEVFEATKKQGSVCELIWD